MTHVISQRIQRSTAVTHSLSGKFTAASNTNDELLVVKSNILSVYQVNTDEFTTLIEVSLSEAVIDCAKISAKGVDKARELDYIVLVLSDYQLSIIQFDPSLCKFKTVSLFDFKGYIPVVKYETYRDTAPVHQQRPRLLIHEWAGTIVLLTNDQHLFLVPFSLQSSRPECEVASKVSEWSDDDDWGDSSTDETTSKVQPSRGEPSVAFGAVHYIDLFASVTPSQVYIRDIVAVADEHHCSLLFLRGSDTSVWSGRVQLQDMMSHKHISQYLQCCVDMFRFECQPSRHIDGAAHLTDPKGSALPGSIKPLHVWSIDKLPFNAYKLVSLRDKRRDNGAVCICQNSFVHLNFKGNSTGFTVNHHGEVEAESEHSTIQWREVAWDMELPPVEKPETNEFLNTLSTKSNGRYTRDFHHLYSKMVNQIMLDEYCFISISHALHSHDQSILLGLVNRQTGHFLSLIMAINNYTVSTATLAPVTVTSPASTLSILAATDINASRSTLLFIGSTIGDSELLLVASKCGALFTTLCNRLVNIAPIVDTVLSSISTYKHEASTHKESVLPFMPLCTCDEVSTKTIITTELALCSGYGAHGKLSFFYNHLPLQSLTSTPLICVTGFTLPKLNSQCNSYYILLSNDVRTVVFDLSHTMEFLSDSALFYTDQPTIFASQLLSTPQAVMNIQITPQYMIVSVELLHSNKANHIDQFSLFQTHISNILPETLSTLYILKVHAVVLSSNALKEEIDVVLLLLDINHTLWSVHLIISPTNSDRAHADYTTLSDNHNYRVYLTQQPIVVQRNIDTFTVFDECYLCVHHTVETSLTGLYYLSLGDSECHWQVLVTAANLSLLPDFLYFDSKEKGGTEVNCTSHKARRDTEEVYIARMTPYAGLGSNVKGSLYLFILSKDQDITVYRFLNECTGLSTVSVQLLKVGYSLHEFTRVTEHTLSYSTQAKRDRDIVSDSDTPKFQLNSQNFKFFSNFNGYTGIHVNGCQPQLIFLSPEHTITFTKYSIIRSTESDQSADTNHNVSPVNFFLPFNHASVPFGALVSTGNSIHFVSLPSFLQNNFGYSPGFSVSNGSTIRILHIGMTPHFIANFHQSKTISLVVSELRPYQPSLPLFQQELMNEITRSNIKFSTSNQSNLSSTLHQPMSYKDNIPVKHQPVYQVLLVPYTDLITTSETKHVARLDFEANEVVLASHRVGLRLDTRISHTSELLLIGVGTSLGEDIVSRGRLVLLRTNVNEGGIMQGSYNTRDSPYVVLSLPMRGAITAINTIDTDVVLAVGACINIYTWDPSTHAFITKAVYHGHVYITSIRVLNSLMLVSDLFNSVTLYYYHNVSTKESYELISDNKIVKICHDSAQFTEVFCAGFLFSTTNKGSNPVNILSSNQHRVLFNWEATLSKIQSETSDLSSQTNIQSNQLSLVSSASVANALSTLTSAPLRTSSTVEFGLVYSTLTGEMGLLQPIHERLFRVLFHAEKRIVAEIEHTAGVSPSSVYTRVPVGHTRPILRSDLFTNSFIALPRNTQQSTLGRGSNLRHILGIIASAQDKIPF